jgi:hypothetical protein
MSRCAVYNATITASLPRLTSVVDTPAVAAMSERDRWWPVGPLIALALLAVVGPPLLLLSLIQLPGRVLLITDPDIWASLCPAGTTCVMMGPGPDAWDAARALAPWTVILASVALLVVSFTGPTTVEYRPLRWTLGASAVALLFGWAALVLHVIAIPG